MTRTVLEQISADVGAMYDITSTFAETVTGPSGDFPAVFDNGYEPRDAGGYAQASSRTPELRCLDANALTKGQAVTVRGTAYVVVEVKPDGYGETRLRLQKA